LRVHLAVPPRAGIHGIQYFTHHQLALGMHINLVVINIFGNKGINTMTLSSRRCGFV